MSVSAAVALPAQPTIGLTSEIPLGGSGTLAPHNMQEVLIDSVSDATAGTNSIVVHTDPRWTSMVAYVRLRVLSAAADIVFLLEARISLGHDGPSAAGTMGFTSGIQPTVTWVPPAMLGTSGGDVSSNLLPMAITGVIPNVDTETLRMSVRVLNFHKNVRALTPLQLITSSQIRGSSTT